MLRAWPALVDPLKRAAAAAAELRPRVVGLEVSVAYGDLSGLVDYPVQRTVLDDVPEARFVYLRLSVAPQLRDLSLVPDVVVSVEQARAELVDGPSGARFVPQATYPPYTVYRRTD
jgi:hypothetical protein